MSNTSKIPILPPRLRRGDTIGLIAPAGPIRRPEDFACGCGILRDLGFNLKQCRPVPDHDNYLAACDDERAAELNKLWADPEVKAIMAVRGGYGCLRMLSGVDLDLIRRTPKILLGFSDITALLAMIGRDTGLVSLHGPVVTSLANADRASVLALGLALTSNKLDPISSPGLEKLCPGTAKGRLIGGNLTTLCHLIGTPFEPLWQDTILLLEDVGEAPYRIDRMLSQLRAAGRLNEVRGIILGRFTDCGNEEDIWHIAHDILHGLSIPIWAGFPVGHGPDNLTLPLGIDVMMHDDGKLHCTTPSLCD